MAWDWNRAKRVVSNVLHDPGLAAGNVIERYNRGMDPLKPYTAYAAEDAYTQNAGSGADIANLGVNIGTYGDTPTPAPIYNQPAPTGGGTAYEPRLAVFGGITYNLDDPNQRQAYYDAQRSYAEQVYNTNMSTLGRTYGQLEEDINQQSETLGRTYGEQTTALQDALQRGLFQSANYYDRIAPSLYQSAEGISRQEKQKSYDEGMTQLNREKSASESEINRARGDLAYYRPLEEQQYAQQKRSVLDQILQDKYSDESSLRNALAADSAISPAAYNMAYAGTDVSGLAGQIGNTPDAGVGNGVVATGKKTTGKEGKTISDYIYGLYPYGI